MPNPSQSLTNEQVYILCTYEHDQLDSVVSKYGLRKNTSFDKIRNMVSVICTPEVAARVHEDAAVKYLRPNIKNIRPFVNRRTTRWNLSAICRSRPMLGANYYSYTNTGAGVDIYIVDTGIRYDHLDFEGRAQALPGWIDPWGKGGQDELGHGTHVAGICAGRYSGVAPGARIYSARVFGPNDGDAATPEQFLSVCDKIILHHESKAGARPSIVNMSLGSSPSVLDPFVYINDPATDGDDYLDDAVQHLVNAGIQVCVAAGNGFYDEVNEELLGRMNAEYVRPARVNSVITVGALDMDWSIAPYSNYGACVDVFAPGTEITSADYRSVKGFQLMSGTSMATPMVTGLCALYLSQNPNASPFEVKDHIIKTSIKGVLNTYGLAESDYLINGDAVLDDFALVYMDLNDDEHPLVYATSEITPNRVLHSIYTDVGSAIPSAFVSDIDHTNMVLETA